MLYIQRQNKTETNKKTEQHTTEQKNKQRMRKRNVNGKGKFSYRRCVNYSFFVTKLLYFFISSCSLVRIQAIQHNIMRHFTYRCKTKQREKNVLKPNRTEQSKTEQRRREINVLGKEKLLTQILMWKIKSSQRETEGENSRAQGAMALKDRPPRVESLLCVMMRRMQSEDVDGSQVMEGFEGF